jgi:hypothetical protein
MSRSTFVTAVRSLVGLQGPALASAIIPTASPAVRAGMDAFSTCELAAAATIRIACGLPEPLPFIPGGDHAARALYTLADPDTGGTPWHPKGALRVAGLETPPDIGDAIWYGPSAAKKPDGSPLHPEHVDACVLEVTGDGGPDPCTELTVRAIAGGQPNGHGHSSAIAEVERVLVWEGGRWVDRGTGRPVWCVIDAGALEERYGVRPDYQE